MRRRDFFKFILGSAAAWPLPLGAQQAAKVYRIGYLGAASHAEYAREIDALLKGLRQLGYEEGKNITIDYRFAEGDYDRLPLLAAKLVTSNVDVLLTHSTPGARAAKQATSTIPIVGGRWPIRRRRACAQYRPSRRESDRADFFLCRDLRKTGRADQGSCSGGNTARRSRESRQPQRQVALTAMQRTARALRVDLLPVDVRAVDDIAGAFAMLASRGAQALTLIEDALLNANAPYIAQLATQKRLPMIGEKPAVEAGAPMAYGADRYDLWFRSAFFVDKILKGTQPADLPIDQAAKFELIINLKTAKALGLTITLPLLARADELIE